jgi:hypothetical protein
MKRNASKWSIVVIGCLAVGFAGGAFASQQMKRNLLLVRAGDAKFVSADPRDPAHSPQVAFVAGDPATGPVAFLLKSKGTTPPHYHSSDYWLVTLEGTTKHYLKGKEADAKENPPGTTWFQPGGDVAQAHVDECLTESGCTYFIVMDKKNDFIPAMGK